MCGSRQASDSMHALCGHVSNLWVCVKFVPVNLLLLWMSSPPTSPYLLLTGVPVPVAGVCPWIQVFLKQVASQPLGLPVSALPFTPWIFLCLLQAWSPGSKCL